MLSIIMFGSKGLSHLWIIVVVVMLPKVVTCWEDRNNAVCEDDDVRGGSKKEKDVIGRSVNPTISR